MVNRTHARPSSPAEDARAFSRAFSMVELVVVMTIIGVVAAIAVPRYASARSQYRVQSAAARLAADYAGLRPSAMALSGTATMSAVVRADSYTLALTSRDTSGNLATSTQTVNLGVEPYKAAFVTVWLSTGTAFGFDAYGNPLGTGGMQLRSGWTLSSVTFAASGDATVSAPIAMTSAQRAALGAP